LFCGRTDGVQLHHPTGREWDPDTLVPLCHDHHRLAEDDWHPAGVGAKVEPPTVLHALRMGMMRWAMLIGRLAEQGVCADLLKPLARWLAEKAALVAQVIDSLDASSGPSWRGFHGIALSTLPTSPS
jgi:hypothetical protein